MGQPREKGRCGAWAGWGGGAELGETAVPAGKQSGAGLDPKLPSAVVTASSGGGCVPATVHPWARPLWPPSPHSSIQLGPGGLQGPYGLDMLRFSWQVAVASCPWPASRGTSLARMAELAAGKWQSGVCQEPGLLGSWQEAGQGLAKGNPGEPRRPRGHPAFFICVPLLIWSYAWSLRSRGPQSLP